MRVIRRHLMLSSVILLLTTTAFAQDTPTAGQTATPVAENSQPLLDTSISLSYYDLQQDTWVDSVTATKLPPGSLITRFDGLHGFAMKQLRGQCRQFVKRAADNGWSVQPEDANRTIYWSVVERDWVGMTSNGAWWTRSWLESREPEDGGAPATPFVHTYGAKCSWRRGPFELTNDFKFKFDYITFFEVDPDPVEAQDQIQQSPITIDVRADSDVVLGTMVVFKFKPKLRLGIPKSSGLASVLRGASLQVSFELVHWGRPIIKGEFQVQWRGEGDLAATFDLALATW